MHLALGMPPGLYVYELHSYHMEWYVWPWCHWYVPPYGVLFETKGIKV